jgi:hypothetical protein
MRLPRTTGTLGGLLIVLGGLWGAVVPFVGPYFSYSFGTEKTWHYSSNRLWLDILPGLVAVIGGLMLIVSAHRASGAFGGWVALVGGGWFVVGMSVSVLWHKTGNPIGAPLGSSGRRFLELIGYFYGLGALIIALAAFAMGRFASRPRIAEEPLVAVGAIAASRQSAGKPGSERTPVQEPAGEEPTASYSPSETTPATRLQ